MFICISGTYHPLTCSSVFNPTLIGSLRWAFEFGVCVCYLLVITYHITYSSSVFKYSSIKINMKIKYPLCDFKHTHTKMLIYDIVYWVGITLLGLIIMIKYGLACYWLQVEQITKVLLCMHTSTQRMGCNIWHQIKCCRAVCPLRGTVETTSWIICKGTRGVWRQK